jgi:hypothetical protein
MKTVKDKIWTWFLPDVEREINRDEWFRHGGKWIIFDGREKIVKLSDNLAPFIDSGEIKSAKYWNGDPSAINVYSLDRDKDKTWRILKKLGARDCRVWEYDYAWDKNIKNPFNFIYSWSSKFRTILKSYGIKGTLDLIRDLFKK